MNPREVPSPLTGHLVPIRHVVDRDITIYEDYCGTWATTMEAQWGDANITGGRLRLQQGLLSPLDTRKTFALARSVIWRTNAEDRVTPLFVLHPESAQVPLIPELNMRPMTLESIYELLPGLSFESKAARTLQNIVLFESQTGPGTGVSVPYIFGSYPGTPSWNDGEVDEEDGMAYACISHEAPLVYRLLESRGLIVIEEAQEMGASTKVFVTPEGYAYAEEISSGHAALARSAFFVCRFTEELDRLYDAAIRPLSAEIRLPIKRIKDIHHIDKIDDRICREIRQATIVIVDLTDQNFNTAFEAGYALALGKPIVWTMKEPEDGIRMPFDIYTYNCLGWQHDKLDSFTEQLRYRIEVALNTASEH